MKQFFVLLTFLSLTIFSQAQKTPTKQNDEKFDIILMMNGDELTGTVKEIQDQEIKFTYKGESLIYPLKKMDILKINFASGRIEFFNKPPLPSESAEQKQEENVSAVNPNSSGDNLFNNKNNRIGDHHNKVAILPFQYLIDKQRAADEMSNEVQQECYSYLQKHSEGLSILDPRTTNALLAKAGVDFNSIESFTMDELAGILGVEYIVDGRVVQTRTGVVSTQSNSYNDRYNNKNNSYSSSGYSTSTSTQKFQTKMNLSIFTDRNTNIFSEEKISIWSTDTYKSTLAYLLKRTPLYKK